MSSVAGRIQERYYEAQIHTTGYAPDTVAEFRQRGLQFERGPGGAPQRVPPSVLLAIRPGGSHYWLTDVRPDFGHVSEQEYVAYTKYLIRCINGH